VFSSPVDYQKPNPQRVPFRFLRYLNTGLLAFAMTVAVVVLVTMRGNIGGVISAFNDPFLIDYASQQGLDIPDSALLNNSGQLPVPSSQSSRSSSSY
jgi:hypothetical protein